MTRHNSVFAGFGQSSVYRHDTELLGDLALEACHRALSDAGLEPGMIDGIATVPEPPFLIDGPQRDGVHFVSSAFVSQSLGLRPAWRVDEDINLGNAAIAAIRAVEAGLCRYALIVRALHSPSGAYGHSSQQVAYGVDQFVAPYGQFYPAQVGGQFWSRYQQVYGSGSRAQMATFVVQARRNGLRYPEGFWAAHKPQQLSVSDYLSARIVATPLCIYDCDLPVQGAGAFVVTTAERGRDLRQRPAYVRGVALSPSREFGAPLGQFILENLLAMARGVLADLWSDSGLGIDRIDVANLYDGFSTLAIAWLASLGICEVGEVFDFIQDGRIDLDGVLPVNPSGGNLGSGRLHGVNHLMDSMLQVSRRAGVRQVSEAELALTTLGTPRRASVILLGSEPE